jgi:DNA-binding transcriptional MerR regulator
LGIASPAGEGSTVADVEDEPLSIGRMSRLSGLTVKALRYYDHHGLIAPATVDGGTGFRYYARSQVATARLVRRLRSVDVPLDEVRRCLDDPSCLTEILLAHRTRLESRAARIAGDLHELMHILNDGWETTMGITPPTEDLLTHEEEERQLAARLFNAVWELLETEDRATEDDDRMLHMAHASRYHWGQVGSPVNLARGEWQCSRVYAVLRRVEPCLHHAGRVRDICLAEGIAGFDLAFAYEALARGHAIDGDTEGARAMTELVLAATEAIVDDDERKIVLADLETIPDQVRFW